MGANAWLHGGGGIEIKGALLVALALISDMVHPDGGDADVLDRQQAVSPDDALEIPRKTEQARIRLPQSRQVARVEVMAPAIEGEPHAVVQNRPPAGEIKLALHQSCQPVIGGPAVQEIALLGQALAPRSEVAGHQAPLA